MRIVIKVGTSILAKEGLISKKRIKALTALVASLHEKNEVILVTSGAIAAGATVIPELDKEKTPNKQALAAVGQIVLMKHYRRAFEKYGINVAQLLLTKDDLECFSKSENAKQSVNILLQFGIVPVVNENDSVVVDELLRGDNDFLSSQVTNAFDGDMLVILSDIDGYYDKNPREFSGAKLLKEVNFISEQELSRQPTPNHKFATGGIVTKLRAADFLMRHNKQMLLFSGFDLSHAEHFFKTGEITKGTLFCKKQ